MCTYPLIELSNPKELSILKKRMKETQLHYLSCEAHGALYTK